MKDHHSQYIYRYLSVVYLLFILVCVIWFYEKKVSKKVKVAQVLPSLSISIVSLFLHISPSFSIFLPPYAISSPFSRTALFPSLPTPTLFLPLLRIPLSNSANRERYIHDLVNQSVYLWSIVFLPFFLLSSLYPYILSLHNDISK